MKIIRWLNIGAIAAFTASGASVSAQGRLDNNRLKLYGVTSRNTAGNDVSRSERGLLFQLRPSREQPTIAHY